jgi:hypothetical protein
MEIARPKRRIAHAIILMGAFIILIGSITPIAYDLEGEAHNFLNNLTGFLILIALLLVVVVLVFYSAFSRSSQIERFMSILLSILAILFLLTGTVFVVAVTAAIIDNEPGWGPGLYIMYVGVLLFFTGSILNIRENRKLIKGIEPMGVRPE